MVEVVNVNTVNVISSMRADGVEIDSHCLNGEYRELCDLIGFDAVEKLYIKYNGGYIHLPKKLLIDEFVHGYIVTCYHSGRKAKLMAREFDYTYSWVLRIIRNSREQ